VGGGQRFFICSSKTPTAYDTDNFTSLFGFLDFPEQRRSLSPVCIRRRNHATVSRAFYPWGARIEFEELMKVRLELEEHELEEIIQLVKRLTDTLERLEELLDDDVQETGTDV